MTFNFWSLDYIYYPVSGIMWVWHKIFGSFLGPNTALTWVLSVVFLIFTLRAILFKPFMKQMESQLKMQAVQPQMKKLREKYKDDKQRLSEEMMKLNKEAGVNPLASCLPALIQAPVFIGLFHVLRMFQPVNEGPRAGRVDLPATRLLLRLRRRRVHGQRQAPRRRAAGRFHDDAAGPAARSWPAIATAIIWWGIPLTILAGIATHLTSRRSVARQREMNIDASGSPQTAIMNKLMLYMFPLFVVVGGPFFPLAILFYWLANNSWTFGQLWVAHTHAGRSAPPRPWSSKRSRTRRSSPPRSPGRGRRHRNRPVIEPTKIADSNGSGQSTERPRRRRHGTANGGAVGQGSTAGTGDRRQAESVEDRRPETRAGAKPAPGARPQRTAGKKKNTQR